MKTISVTIMFYLFFFTSWSQGWRKGEMEVTVFVDKPTDVQAFRNMGLDFEPASADGAAARTYVVPAEMEKIVNSGLRYKVTIADMNRHFEHFWDNPAVPPGYYSYDQIIAIADSLATHFPSICKKISWGTSLGGRQLAALKISDNVGTDEPEAEIMFDGGIHGDEVGGAQNIIMFARDLCLGYGSNPTYTDLINNREIWLYLMVNPDGRVAMSRYNNNGVDCNRDNGYMWNGEGQSTGAFSQVETKALRNCINDNQFVVYTNYHSGTEIIAYPWSYRADAARDYSHINQLASIYSTTSGYSYLSYGQGFLIMYAINGSTKDYQYGSRGNIGWSIEISMDKQPPSSQIMTYYNNNKPAMLELITRCGWGVAGMVTDSVTGEPVRASVWVNSYYPVYTDPEVGDYHKYVLPGTYTIKVVANGYKTKTINNVTVPASGAVTTNFQLAPLLKRYAYKVMSCQIPGNNFDDEGYTPGALGKPDTVPYSLGKFGWIVLDMGDTICDGPGADFKIIQSGTNNKNYTVSGGNNMDGPFTTIGTATGTSDFDIGTVGMTRVRYLYIMDKGTGSSWGPGAGFNLDAVEMITPPLIVDFTASNNLPCTGAPVDFTDQSEGNIVSWNWSFPGGTPSTSTQQNPVNILYASPGTYNVTLTISNGASSAARTKANFIIAVGPQVSLGSDTSACAWSALTLDAGNPGSSYLWSTGDTTQVIQVDSTGVGLGSRDYWVAVSDSSGCSGSDTIKVTWEDCTGLPENKAGTTVAVFPNPAGNFFTLETEGFGGGSWQLLSTLGTKISGAAISSAHYRKSIDVTGISRGIYLLKVQKAGTTVLKKVILNPDAGN